MRPALPPLATLIPFATLLLAVAISGCDPGAVRPRASGPDVLLIVVDTLRADRLTQYGHVRDTSSALARLTGSATRFDACTSPAPWTAPAVASILTGLAPARHGVDAVGSALPDGAPGLARSLRRAGWHTIAVSFNPHVTKAAGFGQGFDTFLDYRGRAGRAPDIRAMTAEAIDRIDDLEGEGRPRDPFFLYLQPMNVHGPYRVPEDARSLLLGRPPSEAFTFFGELMRGLMNHRRLELRNDVGAEMLASLDEQYDTAVRHSAEELGHFFDALADRALFDDALVVLTADHGEELFDHGGFAHRYSLYDEVLHVPLFVKLPGQREARTVAEPVSLLDLRATIEEVVGIEPAPSLAPASAEDGLSLAPLLTGPASEVPPQLRDRAFVAQAKNPRRMVGRSLRVGDDVLIVTERSWDGLENAVRLYDLTADPRQLEDLSDSDPERVAWMRDRLEAVEAEQRAAPLEQQHYEISPGLAKALEVLGYL